MTKFCVHCNSEFEAKRESARFCCDAHKVAHGRGVTLTPENALSVTGEALSVTEDGEVVTVTGDSVTGAVSVTSVYPVEHQDKTPDCAKGLGTLHSSAFGCEWDVLEDGLARGRIGFPGGSAVHDTMAMRHGCRAIGAYWRIAREQGVARKAVLNGQEMFLRWLKSDWDKVEWPKPLASHPKFALWLREKLAERDSPSA